MIYKTAGGFNLLRLSLLLVILISSLAYGITVGGYWDTNIDSLGGKLSILCLADEDYNRVEILYQGIPTGVELPLAGSEGGFNTFFFSAPIGSQPEPALYLLELRAYGEDGLMSSTWPYLSANTGTGYAIFYHQDDYEAVAHIAGRLAEYITQMSGAEVELITLSSLSDESRLWNSFDKAGFVLNPQVLSPQLFGDFVSDPMDEESYKVESLQQGSRLLYLVAGEGKLGIQYGVYDFLHELGVRFFHPEQEWIPDTLELPHPFNMESQPAFKYRGFGIHTTHPLDIIDPLSDSNISFCYAANINDWLVKLHTNQDGKGAVRGVAPEHRYQQRAQQLNEYNRMLGFRHGAGISLHGSQQGGRPDVDWNSEVPPEDQIRDHIDRDLGNNPDNEWFCISYGYTEYTAAPCDETLYYIQFAGQYVLDNYPHVLPIVNSHITGDQPCADYNQTDFYDLGIYTDPDIGIKWHTVMFYDLFGPAPCYRQSTFNHKWRYMQQEAQRGRKQIYFPEGGYWLSFDNAIPMFYPVYLYTRWLDIQAVKELIPRGMIGHRQFTTGWEWGYWMHDYMVGQLHWNPDLNWTDVVADWTIDIMGDAGTTVHRVLCNMARYQYHTLITKQLTKYLSGEDEIDEIGAELGFQAQELRPYFTEIYAYNKQQLYEFVDGDLNQVWLMCQQYGRYLAELDAVADQVPDKAVPWFREIYDGTQINWLRCRHIYHLYQAVVKYRLDELDPIAEARDYMADYNMAVAITDDALQVIHGRELDYRYPLEWSIGGGLTPETEEENGTVYKYRYLHKTHIGHYWTRRNHLAYEVITGQADPFADKFYLYPAIAYESEPLYVHFPEFTGLEADLNFGDGSTGDETTQSHVYSGKGFWKAISKLTLPGLPEPEQRYEAYIGRVGIQAYAPKGSLSIIDPEIPILDMIIKSVIPGMHLGLALETKSEIPFFIIGLDHNQDRCAEDFTTTPMLVKPESLPGFETEPTDMNLTFQYGISDTFINLSGKEWVFAGSITEGAVDTPVNLHGGLTIESIILALIQVGGMDYEGARILIANLLGYEPEQLPDILWFTALLEVEEHCFTLQN